MPSAGSTGFRRRSVRVLDAAKPLSEAMCDLLLDDPLTETRATNAVDPAGDPSGAVRRFDLAEVLVLVPGRKLVRSLEHGLLERSGAAGAPLVSPTFVTPARLASLVVDPFGPVADAGGAVGALLSETAERIVWRRALESVFAEDPAAVEAVFGRGLERNGEDGQSAAQPMLEPRVVPTLVERLMRLSRETLGACADFASIARGVAALAEGSQDDRTNGAFSASGESSRGLASRGLASRGLASRVMASRVMASRLANAWRTIARIEARFEIEASRGDTVRAPHAAAIVRALAAGSVLAGGFRRVVVLLADPEPLHRAILRALEARGVAVEVCVHRPFEAGGSELDDEGFPVIERWAHRPFPEAILPSDVIFCAGAPEDQAAQAVRALERIAAPRRSDRIAFVSGDGPTRRRLECELLTRGVALASAAERPFVETRIGQLLARLERLLDARSSGAPSLEAFAAFVRHPDVAARLAAEGIDVGPDAVSRYRATCASESIDDRVPSALSGSRDHAGFERLRCWTVELLDGALRGAGTRESGAGGRESQDLNPQESAHQDPGCQDFSVPSASGDGREVAERLDHALVGRAMVSARSRRPAQAWAPAIRALLERIVGDGAITDDERVVDERHRAVRALDDALAELAAVPVGCSVELTLAEAIAIVLARLGSSIVRDHAGSDGVPILGWLDAGIADEPDLVVVGMNEGVVPESSGGDALLPDALREALGLPSSARRVARDAWILDGMLARRAGGRGAIAFIVGRQDAAGDPLRPSRFLLSPGEDGEALARRVVLLTGETVSGETHPLDRLPHGGRSDSDARESQSRAPLAFPITPEIATARIESVSVTGFARYMKCPYLFLLERDPRLRLRSDDEDALELDPLAFGNLVHGALEIWGREEADRSSPTDDATRIRREVLAALEVHTRRHFGRHRAPAVDVQIELARRRLERFAEIQAREAAAGWRIRFVELGFEAPKGVSSHDATAPSLVSGEEARAFLDAAAEDASARAPSLTRHSAIRIGRSPDGRELFVTGRIDRVDQHADGRYRALDYKTSASGQGPAAGHLSGRGALDKRKWKDLQLPLYRRLLASIGIDVGSRLGYIVLAPKLAQCRVAMLEVGGAPIDIWKLDEANARADEIADAILAGEFTPAGGPRGASCPVRADDPLAAIWGKGYRGIDTRIDGDSSGDGSTDAAVDAEEADSAEGQAASATEMRGSREVAP